MILIEDMVSKGKGIYTLAEVARYARMHRVTVSRWFKGDKYCNRVFAFDDSKVIGFLDFVQVLAVRNLRSSRYNVPLQKIREAVDRASNDFGISHPFAYRHTTYLFAGEIWIQPEGKVLTQISGKGYNQTGILPVIERFYEDVVFDPQGMAKQYSAFEKSGHRILMDPKIRFGEPLLEGCGYTPWALVEAATTEGSSEAAAKFYGVSREQVDFCIDYFDYLEAA